MQWLATTNHLIPPVGNQVPYSMLVRGATGICDVKAADTVLDETVLDAIDELVPPGTNFVERDAGAVAPSLEYANCVGGNRR